MQRFNKVLASVLFCMLFFWGINASAATFNSSLAPNSIETKNNFPVSAIEDLMREHGLLSRVLLIYEKELQLINEGNAPDRHVIFQSATIVKKFVEDYHEKLEEDYIFPLFVKAHKLTDLVTTLKQQHKHGRQLTAIILQITGNSTPINNADRIKLSNSLKRFIIMYRPHKAREDTVLFPALHTMLSKYSYRKLGDLFEDKEQELFGANGFERMLNVVTKLEEQIGINDLNQFTPDQM